jgi:hypothetical protein
MTRHHEISENPFAAVTGDELPRLIVSDACRHGLRWKQVRKIDPGLVADTQALEAFVAATTPVPCDAHSDIPRYLWPNQ